MCLSEDSVMICSSRQLDLHVINNNDADRSHTPGSITDEKKTEDKELCETRSSHEEERSQPFGLPPSGNSEFHRQSSRRRSDR